MALARILLEAAYILRANRTITIGGVVNAPGRIIKILRVICPVFRVITVVVLTGVFPIQIGARVDNIDTSDTAIQRERRLIPLILRNCVPHWRGLQIAVELWIVVPATFNCRILINDARRNRPIVVQIDLQQCTQARYFLFIVVISCKIKVISRGGLRPGEGHGRRHGVDIAGRFLGPCDQPHSRALAYWKVAESVYVVALISTLDRIHVYGVA